MIGDDGGHVLGSDISLEDIVLDDPSNLWNGRGTNIRVCAFTLLHALLMCIMRGLTEQIDVGFGSTIAKEKQDILGLPRYCYRFSNGRNACGLEEKIQW